MDQLPDEIDPVENFIERWLEDVGRRFTYYRESKK